jgi:TPR repeat protein
LTYHPGIIELFLKREHTPKALTISQEAFSMTRLLLSIGTALLLTVGTVWAGPFEDATAANKRGDYATALKTFQLLAAQGNVEAQVNLGMLYANGQGVPQDYAQARQWYEKAAAQGDALAQNNLAELYYAGLGVPQDDVRAYMWVNLAAAHMTGEEQKQAEENRDDVARRMTPAQIAEAKQLAQQCRSKKFKGC